MKKNRTHKLDRTSSQLDEVFGRPALLKGEDRANYRELQKEISESMHPENFLDALEVQEVVDNIWEGRRFQRMGTKLVDAERRKAFEHLTNSRYGYVSEKAEEWLESNAGKTEAARTTKVGGAGSLRTACADQKPPRQAVDCKLTPLPERDNLRRENQSRH